MSKVKNLYVCYCRLNSSHESESKPVYCYAFSHCHAVNLAIRYCVDCWHWELNSFQFSEPILLTSFAR